MEREKQIVGTTVGDEFRNPDVFARQAFKKPLSETPSVNSVQRSVFNSNNLIASNESQLIAQDNPSRSYFLIQNQGTGSVFVNFGQQAGQGIGLEVSAGGYYEPVSIPTNAIYIWAATNVQIFFSEGEPLR